MFRRDVVDVHRRHAVKPLVNIVDLVQLLAAVLGFVFFRHIIGRRGRDDHIVNVDVVAEKMAVSVQIAREKLSVLIGPAERLDRAVVLGEDDALKLILVAAGRGGRRVGRIIAGNSGVVAWCADEGRAFVRRSRAAGLGIARRGCRMRLRPQTA